MNDQSLLDKQQGGVWLLNANLVVEKGSSLTIDSKDTTWLKIVSDETNPHGIRVLGSLKVDSVKITSWDPLTNDYPRDEGAREPGPDGYRIQQGSPRAFIRVENDDNDHNNAGGTSNITNSEIAYLGFEGGIGAGFTGLSYRGGEEGERTKKGIIYITCILASILLERVIWSLREMKFITILTMV